MVSKLHKTLTAMGTSLLESYTYCGGVLVVLTYQVDDTQNGGKSAYMIKSTTFEILMQNPSRKLC